MLYIVNVAETISIIQSLNMPLYVAIIKALWDRLSEVSTALSTITVSDELHPGTRKCVFSDFLRS